MVLVVLYHWVQFLSLLALWFSQGGWWERAANSDVCKPNGTYKRIIRKEHSNFERLLIWVIWIKDSALTNKLKLNLLRLCTAQQKVNVPFFCKNPEGYLIIIYFINSVIYFLAFFCEEPGESYLVIIYFINSVIIYFLTFVLWRIQKRFFDFVWVSGKQ